MSEVSILFIILNCLITHPYYQLRGLFSLSFNWPIFGYCRDWTPYIWKIWNELVFDHQFDDDIWYKSGALKLNDSLQLFNISNPDSQRFLLFFYF